MKLLHTSMKDVEQILEYTLLFFSKNYQVKVLTKKHPGKTTNKQKKSNLNTKMSDMLNCFREKNLQVIYTPLMHNKH